MAVEISKQPPREQPPLWRRLDAEIKLSKTTSFARWVGTLTYTLMPALELAATSTTLARANLGAGAVMLAAERYRRAKGTWPESIHEIEKALAIELPLDPYDSAPYKLVRTETGLTIYSLGTDLIDNGGNFGEHNLNIPNTDRGCRLWDVAHRRQAPSMNENELRPTR
jgi:hypothetical protein